MRTVRIATILLALLAGGLFSAPVEAATGQMRVLYVLATWGPPTFGPADVQRVAAETDAYFQASSSGRLSMPGAVAGPITLRRAVFDSCDATVLRNEAPTAMFSGYERVAFITPYVASCPFAGEANPTEVLLNGTLYRNLAAHELGHTLPLGHASRWVCSRCPVEEYGSAFSVMGGGGGDLNAFEKSRLDWLTGLVRPRGNATHEIGSIEGPTALPQALVVTTAASEFWFETRGQATPSFLGDSVQPPGMTVVAGPSLGGSESSPFPRENLLLANPSGGARYAYAAGESFVRPGSFQVFVERHAPEAATLRFRWLDRVAPSKPRVRARVSRRGRVRVAWEPPRERGSGIETYTLLVDGRARRTVDRDFLLISGGASFRLSRGRHRVGVRATDRAGNRGRASWVRVRVK